MPVDLANLSVVRYPDPILRTRCRPVPEVTEEVREVARRMIEVMFQADGVGLAAPQVGLPWRLFVCHVPEDGERSASDSPPSASAEPQVHINPVLSAPAPPLESLAEGCLSLPDITGDIPRPRTVTIESVGLDGQTHTRTATGLLARCWQHENDHLDGVLILDRMTHLSRLRVRSAVRGLERAAGRR